MDACYSLELTPSALSILLAQSGTVTDTPAGGNCFKVCNLSNDFKVHVATCYQEEEGDANEKPNVPVSGGQKALAFCPPLHWVVRPRWVRTPCGAVLPDTIADVHRPQTLQQGGGFLGG
jgi:hypothetical protein